MTPQVLAAAAYRDGATSREAAARFGVHESTVRRAAARSYLYGDRVREEALALARRGMTPRQVSAALARNGVTVPPPLVQWWCQPRRPGPRRLPGIDDEEIRRLREDESLEFTAIGRRLGIPRSTARNRYLAVKGIGRPGRPARATIR